jgi:hypothetical protein
MLAFILLIFSHFVQRTDNNCFLFFVTLLDETLQEKKNVELCEWVSEWVRDTSHDALYWLRAVGYKLLVFTNLTFAYNVLSPWTEQPLQGICGMKIREGFHLPRHSHWACVCSELYHILYNNPVAVENGAQSGRQGRNVTDT